MFLRCSVIVFLVVCEFIGGTSIQGAPPAGMNSPASVAANGIKPAPLNSDTEERQLPGVVQDACVGGGGRYFVLYLPGQRNLAIFDVNEAKVVKYLSLAGGDAKFAAGMEKLFVVYPDRDIIQRFSLATFEKEVTAQLPLNGTVKAIATGSAAAGPLLVHYDKGGGALGDAPVTFLDPVTFKELKLGPGEGRGQGVVHHSSRDTFHYRASPDGTVFGGWVTSYSQSMSSIVISGNSARVYQGPMAGSVVPAMDNTLVTAGGLYTPECRPRGGDNAEPRFRLRVPSLGGPFYITCPGGGGAQLNTGKMDTGKPVDVYLSGDSRPIATLKNVELPASNEAWTRTDFTQDKRVLFVPEAKLIAIIPKSNDRLVLHRFDVEDALKKSNADYLFVVSRPPLSVKAGDRLLYRVSVKSRAGGISYSLESGPPGMRMSPTGLLTWTTSAQSPAANSVIIAVKDKSDQQVFHSFRLTVVNGVELGVEPAVAEGESATRPSALGVGKAIATTPTEVAGGSQEIKLPGTLSDVAVGGAGRFLLFHLRDLKKIAVLDVSKAKIAGYLPASDDNTRVVAGATKALIFNLTQGVVTRYQLDTLQRELSVAIPFSDLITFMGMGAGAEGPILLRTSQGSGQLDFCRFQFMDINTMKPMAVTWANGNQPHSVYRDFNDIQVSTNGEAFAVQGIGVLRLDGTTVRVASGEYGGFGGYPMADGKNFLSLGGRLFNADLRMIGDQSANFNIAVPSVTGSYFLSFRHSDSYADRTQGGKQVVKLYMLGDSRPLVTIPDIVDANLAPAGYHSSLGWNKRLFFIPDAQAIVTVPASNDRVLFRRFKIDDALEASGVDYLIVASQAPAVAELGKPYVYAMQVKSKRGGVKYSLDASPPGMKVSADGKITWDVPKDMTEDKTNVIVSVRDASGQETFHTFSIEIAEIKQKLAAAQKARDKQQHAAREDSGRPEMERRQAALPAGSPSGRGSFRPVMRTWTDSSGQFQMKAKFVEISDKKVVLLELENGQTRKVPLSRLSNEDIYEAVKCDLLQSGTKLPATADPPISKP